MKKVMIIGAGAQGNVIAGVLCKAEDVGEILLCDIDEDRAKEVSEYLGSPKIATARLDATDVKQMTDRMNEGEFNLIINATPIQFNRPILQATLAAKTHYLDLASDEMLESSTPETVQSDPTVQPDPTVNPSTILQQRLAACSRSLTVGVAILSSSSR